MNSDRDPADGLTASESRRFEMLSAKTVQSLTASEADELAALLRKRLTALEQREPSNSALHNKYRAVLRILSASSTGAAIGAGAGLLGWSALGLMVFPGIGTLTGAIVGATVATLLKNDSRQ